MVEKPRRVSLSGFHQKKGGALVNYRKWLSPVNTSTRVEYIYKKIGDILGIETTQATNAGYEVLIEDRLSNIDDQRITPDLVKEFREVRNHHLKELEIVLHRRIILDEKARELEEKKSKIKEQRQLITTPIKVWDLAEERYKTIPECDFNELIHQKVLA